MCNKSIRVAFVCAYALVVMPGSGVQAADTCAQTQIQCIGFEPNFRFTTGFDLDGKGAVTFIDPENPEWETEPLILAACVTPNQKGGYFLTSADPVRLQASVSAGDCTQPDDNVRPWSARVDFVQGALGDAPKAMSGRACCIVKP